MSGEIPPGMAPARIVPTAAETLVPLAAEADAYEPAWETLVAALFDMDRPTSTYAIVDATALPGLTEMLETSGLTHACLLHEAAEEDVRDAAPWLVRLEPGHTLFRWLWTTDPTGDVPWHLADRDAAIFVRSKRTFREVLAHFRRKVRITDSDGKAFFFRFWDPLYCLTLLESDAVSGAGQQWLVADNSGPIGDRIICRTLDQSFVADIDPDTPPGRQVLRITPELRAALAAAVARRAEARDVAAVRRLFPKAPAKHLRAERAHLKTLGFRRKEAIRAVLCLCAHRRAVVTALPAEVIEILQATRQSDLARVRMIRRAIGDWPQQQKTGP